MNDIDAGLLVFVVDLQSRKLRGGTEVGNPSSGNDPLFDRRAGCVECIFHARLLLLHFHFGRRTDLQNRHAARQFREPLLELLLVVVRGGLLDLGLDLVDPLLDIFLLARSLDDGGVVLIDGHLLRLAEIVQRGILELVSLVFRNHRTAGQHRDVFQHRLAAIAEPRRLHGSNPEGAAQLIHDERCERFAFQVLGDNEDRASRLRHLLKDRKEVLHRRDLLVMDEDDRVLENRFHCFGIGHEIRRKVPAVELHPFDDFNRRLGPFRLFHRNDAVGPDFHHCVGNEFADDRVVVGRDGANLGDLFLARLVNRLAELFQAFDHFRHSQIYTPLQVHRVRTCCNHLQPFPDDGLCKHRGGGGAIACHVGCLRRNLTHHLGSHVLQGVFQFDLFRDCHAVLGDGRRAEFLVDDHIAPLRAQCHLHCISQLVHAPFQSGSGFHVVLNDLCCHDV